jgi:hypothetical protein
MDGLDAISETAGAAALEVAVSAIVERGGKVGPCPNCASPMFASYCALCGQPADTHRRSVFVLAHDFISDLASFDSRILRTARALLFEPGELPLAFREGRTQRYVPPVRLYLFMTLIFFLTLSFAGIALLQLTLATSTVRYTADKNHNVFIVKNGVAEPMEDFKTDDKGNVYLSEPGLPHKSMPRIKADGSLNQTLTTEPYFFARIGSVKPTPAPAKFLADLDRKFRGGTSKRPGVSNWISEHLARMFKVMATDPAAINGPLTEWIPRVLFILLPVFALLLAAFYWRQRKQFFFVDHLVFSLNIHTFGFALLLIAAGLAQIWSAVIVAGVAAVAMAIYLLLAMKRFYRQSWLWTSLKFSSVGFLYGLGILPSALASIIAYSLLNL